MTFVPKIYSSELDGIHAELIEVEADINVGLHSFNIVGLADKAVNEAKERVNSALKNSGIKPPTRENRKITINLAPADIKKTGARFDLPIALAYLLASEQIKPFPTAHSLFLGELSLDGTLRSIPGALNTALLAKRHHIECLYLPKENAEEAAIVKEVRVIPVSTLKELIEHLEDVRKISPTPHTPISPKFPPSLVTLSEIKGHETAKRALLVAAAGGHSLLMSGPPGTGKTMLAQAFASILTPPTIEESLEITEIYSASGLTKKTHLIEWRPFRAPHHSASFVSILGGGSNPKPGEISLAHRGVLFLDEMPEFHRDVLEGLRQPLEEGKIHIARAKSSLVFPARFILIASMNPCPCGYLEDTDKECHCTANEVFRYQKKISGPLLDRMDIHLEIPRIQIEELRKPQSAQNDGEWREKVLKAKGVQTARFQSIHPKIWNNAEMSSKQVEKFVTLDSKAEDFLKQALERSFLSPRGFYRILKVARTIADLENSNHVTSNHIAEAFQYRLKANE